MPPLSMEFNNFYASFTNVDKESIRKTLKQHGFKIGKASWTDYEVQNDWAELILDGDNDEPLLHGIVDFLPDNITKLDLIFDSLNGHYQYEFSNEDNKVIFEKTV